MAAFEIAPSHIRLAITAWLSLLVACELVLVVRPLVDISEGGGNLPASAVLLLGLGFLIISGRSIARGARPGWLLISFLIGEPAFLVVRAVSRGYGGWVLGGIAILGVNVLATRWLLAHARQSAAA